MSDARDVDQIAYDIGSRLGTSGGPMLPESAEALVEEFFRAVRGYALSEAAGIAQREGHELSDDGHDWAASGAYQVMGRLLQLAAEGEAKP